MDMDIYSEVPITSIYSGHHYVFSCGDWSGYLQSLGFCRNNGKGMCFSSIFAKVTIRLLNLIIKIIKGYNPTFIIN